MSASILLRMNSRQELVNIMLQELQDATDCSGLDGLTSASLEVQRLLDSLKLPPPCIRHFQGELEVDPIAHSLYPSDAPKNMLPLQCHGPGSHLFEAASVLLWGSPQMALELQVHTVVEMLLHKHYYLNEMIDSKVMLQAVRYSLCTEDSAPLLQLPLQVLQAIYEADIRATCFPGTFANMWHVYALASVLQANVYSIYPQRNQSIRPYFNRLIRPRSGPPEPLTLHIMWSGQPLPHSGFRPNGFVPVVGLEELENLPPTQTLQLLNSDPQLTYSHLHQRYSITKSTFYRWKRQSREHRRRVAARYEAKRYLQGHYQQTGNMMPFKTFLQLYPSISRSTYYAWKHELLQMAVTVPFPSPPSTPEGGEDIEGTAGILNGARSYLERCISLNTLVPYRSFKTSFPGVSRSTYYNWRRKALQGQTQPTPSTRLQDGTRPVATTPLRPHHTCWVTNSSRTEARRRVQDWNMPYCRFKLLYPHISGSVYSLWRAGAKTRTQTPSNVPTQETSPLQGPYKASVECISVPESSIQGPLVDLTGNGQFKAEAKLFLQRRFETHNFPSYREFQGLFPCTARSTYYMWKRALHGGLMLVNP
ncbi:vertnin [Rhinophrynus dorsalis]